MQRTYAIGITILSTALALYLEAGAVSCAHAQEATVTAEEMDAGNRFAEEMIAQKQAASLAQPKRKAAKNTQLDDPAWSSIRSQKVETAKPLTLIELIDIALRNNPTTRQAWFIADAAVAQKKQAQSSLFPQVQAGGDVAKEKTVSTRDIDDLDVNHYGPNATLTYLLLDFGGRSASIQGATQRVLAANSQYDKSVQDLLLNVEKAYYGLYSAQSTEEAARSDAEAAKKDLEAAQARFGAGLVPKLDVLQAQSDYDDSLYTLEVAKNDVQRAKALLAQEIGVAADTPFAIAVPTQEPPTHVTEQGVTSLIEEAVRNRPDIVSSRAVLAAKQSAVKVANSALWPTLGVSGEAGKNWNDYHAPTDGNEHDYALTGSLVLNWDVFDGFNNLNKRRQAKSEMDAEIENLVQAELQASVDVWTKYHDYSAAVSKYKFSIALFESANASYQLAYESYKAGLKSILDLIAAQNQLSSARSKSIQSKQEVFVALADLAHATGSLTVESVTSVQ